jgi:hypothetical protein
MGARVRAWRRAAPAVRASMLGVRGFGRAERVLRSIDGEDLDDVDGESLNRRDGVPAGTGETAVPRLALAPGLGPGLSFLRPLA